MNDDPDYGPTVDDQINAGARVAFILLVLLVSVIAGLSYLATWLFTP